MYIEGAGGDGGDGERRGGEEGWGGGWEGGSDGVMGRGRWGIV